MRSSKRSMPRLDGQRVLVTRPAHQADTLCDLIESAGGIALRYPVLAIVAIPESETNRLIIEQLERYHLAIFISPNAVNFGLDRILELAPLPANLRLATVGKGSSRELQRRLGREPDLCPTGRFNSEALLALPALQQVSGKQILIVRGTGGRELLAETLRERGAGIDYLEVYRRTRPDPPPSWPGKVDIITVTSSEGLQNLFDMIAPKHREELLATPLVVVSERSASLARELGFRQAVTKARNASNEALLDAVIETLA